MKKIGIIVLGIIILLAVWVFSSYNGIVRADQNVQAKWGAVQSDYQRRTDLIPNLVSTVRGAANFEQETLTQVTEARARATSIQVSPGELTPENIQRYQNAQGEIGAALGRLLAVSENYPQLRATESFRDLQSQLEGTENRIKVSRNDFNGAVQDYNVKVKTFPSNIAAAMFGYGEKGFFTAETGSDQVPRVDFGQ